PFRVGDYIEAQGVAGTVVEIQIFVTKLITGNNQTIFVPNGMLSNGTIINYSLEKIRRADLSFPLSYDTDIRRAREIIASVLASNEKVLKTPAPVIEVKEMTEAAIVLAIRPWANNEDYSKVLSDT